MSEHELIREALGDVEPESYRQKALDALAALEARAQRHHGEHHKDGMDSSAELTAARREIEELKAERDRLQYLVKGLVPGIGYERANARIAELEAALRDIATHEARDPAGNWFPTPAAQTARNILNEGKQVVAENREAFDMLKEYDEGEAK